MINKTIILIRHAEAKKNVEGLHGGDGSGLTNYGDVQSNSICRYIKNNYPLKDSVLLAHNIQQVLETADILKKNLKIPLILNENMRGIDMGALAGLSQKQAATEYPEHAKNLELWRDGKANASVVHFPKGETLGKFKERIESAWQDLLLRNETLLLLTLTRSALIMIFNIINMDTEFYYEKYAAYEFDNASISTIELVDSKCHINSYNVTDHY